MHICQVCHLIFAFFTTFYIDFCAKSISIFHGNAEKIRACRLWLTGGKPFILLSLAAGQAIHTELQLKFLKKILIAPEGQGVPMRRAL